MESTLAIEDAVRAVRDPEIPVISLGDLGVIRSVQCDEAARTITVQMTPTYSGCPAIEVMCADVEAVIRQHGYTPQIDLVLSPAWTTDWISDSGREAMQRFGIAPPGTVRTGPTRVGIGLRVAHCPVCGSDSTEVVSEFGSTACKALRRCRECKEPFEEFKPL